LALEWFLSSGYYFWLFYKSLAIIYFDELFGFIPCFIQVQDMPLFQD
jgi:hypothetical protein